jgi:hypothetical protein
MNQAMKFPKGKQGGTIGFEEFSSVSGSDTDLIWILYSS